MPRLSKIGAAALAAFGWTTGAAAVSASYLQVAGGGGGGFIAGGNRGAGGGAGGLLTGTVSLNPTLSYTVTVGAGGTPLANGSNSTITGTGISVTASVGGGAGGSQDGASSVVGQNGGSGGGGPSQSGTGSNAAGTGTSGQGNDGAAGTNAGGQPFGCGGGGGAGAVGTLSNNPAGAGGVGLTSSITGTSTYYAGGGGGGTYAAGPGVGGTGGLGGGGTGGGSGGNSTSGTANLGGGGGGAEYAQTSGSSGGSGVVIISYVGAQQFGGGVVTSSGGNTIHTFTTSGTLSPLSSLTASYLIVAGGGGGGGPTYAGGGGAGGLLSGSGITLDTNSIYAVTVGAGGAGGSSSAKGVNGSNSLFSMVSTTAVGGGGGAAGDASGNENGNSGGSGGGGGSTAAASPNTGTGGAGTSGQGNAGGNGGTDAATYRAGGGGGGSGGVGGNNSSGTAGNGGAGTANSISGSSVTYAGGGGGSGNTANGTATGGGGTTSSRNGTDNLGGGGGGANTTGTGGNGGSGVVIISYPGSTQLMAGGTVTVAGGNVIHTFTSSGYLTPIVLVNNSLRFRASASAYLNRTPTTASNRQTWTWSGWVKRGILGSAQNIFASNGTTNTTFLDIRFTSSDTIQVGVYTDIVLVTSQVFRDPSAWYHIVWLFDTTQASASNRCRLFVNGTEITAFSTDARSTYFAQNTNYGINNNTLHEICRNPSDSSKFFDGYMTEINFIDGQALTPNSFGTSNGLGVWQPIRYGGSYGTNGFYLPFTNSGSVSTNYLVVAGGGGAGESFGAGGGGGGVVSGTTTLNQGSSYTVTVGAGGANQVNTTGGNSSFTGLTTAIGGGCGGGSSFPTGTAGGSGGGGRGGASPANGGAGTAGQGNAGGNGTSVAGGGGGGAGGAGVTSGNTQGGAGGAGIANPITGSTAGQLVSGTYYLAGGGSGNGTGGGQTPGNGGTAVGTAGAANTGAGAGGDNPVFGGSGIVIVSYAGTPKFTGGTITQVGGNTIHTFTSSGTLNGIGSDYSPNGNNWTANNFSFSSGSTYDSMTDVPTLTSATTANYAVFNALGGPGGALQGTLTNGNLTWTSPGTDQRQILSTMPVNGDTTGKWYCEITATSKTSTYWAMGVFSTNVNGYSSTSGYAQYRSDGAIFVNGSNVTTVASYTTGDVIGITFDASNNQIVWYKNNTSVSTQTVSNSASLLSYFGCGSDNSGGSNVNNVNFGQQPFVYTPPTGFVRLNTFNLPTPTIGATASTQAGDYFNTVLYTGNGGSQSVTGVGFQPDWVWVKVRNSTQNHSSNDSVRGAGNYLVQNATAAERFQGEFDSFDSDGFSLTFDAGEGDYNASGKTYVAWNWRANQGTNVTNTDGSIISTVSANTTAGFSIVTYTGNGANSTVGHGLGVAPSMIIVKARNVGTQDWQVYHVTLGINQAIQLNLTSAASPATNYWFNGVTSTVFGVNGSYPGVNGNTNTYVAYCFAPIAGYSAFGSYTGNGSTDGTFVFTGFRPKYVLIKSSSNVEEWHVHDTARDTYNLASADLYPNTSDAEVTSFNQIDILSNGFKMRSSNTGTNGSGYTFIYMAFAESPLKFSNAR